MFFCLASGATFGAMAVFGKLAYAEGATVGTLLALRFLFASGLFWAGGAGRSLPARRDVLIALGLGAGGYALQAGLYFTALPRIDAGVLSLLVFTFPIIVAVAAVALGRERLTRRRALALGASSAGLVLVVGGAGALDPVGVALGLGAAVVYSGYILVSESVAKRMSPLTLAALVCTGAAGALTVGTVLVGQFQPGELTVAGWWWLLCLAGVSTVAAIALFFAGLARVGPTRSAILATVEPLVTVILAFVVFGETIGLAGVLGGGLVLAAVLLVQTGDR
ncbi:DMT family transporter [Solirubrobacter sp. CPCC 204708]|uniref:DMT family transporter n=1 Tax=Solirubrobacter deserti TaxID=2282478 RepID=A0ABT4RE40_9ACTN|nr:DMT family transporter [Solirubrobacter deserti]MBE2316052.1 DMT family transporter [Solirubrobacter deserti]MDA0136804.1 DMT family transporter [Solirubrobacter deserti]